MIAETAYFLAQERGVAGGDTVVDWIEAERQVDRKLFVLATAQLLERLQSGVATKKLAALTHRASTLKTDARTELYAEVDKLGELKDALRGRIEELAASGEDVSQKTLRQAEKVWSEVGNLVQRIGTRTSASH